MSESSTVIPDKADYAYQEHILQGVSRTFALTIPQLPGELSGVVSNAYLLCRIADTIEDDKDMPFEQKTAFSTRFINVVAAKEPSESFAEALHPLLSPSASDGERDLILHTASVLRISYSFNVRQRQALERCIQLMVDGMTRFQESDVKNGLQDQEDMDQYCYFVAGVVGEMLTELFCDYSHEINQNHGSMMKLAVSFGQGLQMTNILKDIWEDQSREMCWLPRDVFEKYGLDLSHLSDGKGTAGFQQAMQELIGVAHSHLANALRYTLLIPAHEEGIRRFCLWALGMAVLTLRKINNNPDFIAGNQVKISRRTVKACIFFTNVATRHDVLLKLLFKLSAVGLPKRKLAEKFSPIDKAN
jgi:farnesyl-diphosphate farnesyltransferase